MTGSPIAKVSDTAFWVAHYRGLEGERGDALFQDPLAALLAGERGRKIAQAIPGGVFTSWIVVLRTCIIDDFIQRAIADGVDTILNLGAGLDTRPYRMDLPGTLTWIEVDTADIIAFKEEQLRNEVPRCRLTRLRRDLAIKDERESVLAKVNSQSKKFLVLTEGVVPYLSNDDVAALAEELKSLDRVAYWVVDYFSAAAVKRRPRQLQRKMRNAPFKFAPEDWTAFFETHGWRAQELRYFADEAVQRKRPLKLPRWLRLIFAIHSIVRPEQRKAFRTLAGFALLEPTVSDA